MSTSRPPDFEPGRTVPYPGMPNEVFHRRAEHASVEPIPELTPPVTTTKPLDFFTGLVLLAMIAVVLWFAGGFLLHRAGDAVHRSQACHAQFDEVMSHQYTYWGGYDQFKEDHC